MKRVTTAVVLIPLVLLAVFRAPSWLFAVIVGMIALLAVHEYLNIADHCGVKTLRTAVFVLVSLIFFSLVLEGITDQMHTTGMKTPFGVEGASSPLLSAMLYTQFLLETICVSGAVFVILALALRRSDLREGFTAAAFSVAGFFYVGVSLYSLVVTRRMAGGFYVLFLLIVIWVGDTAAYYVGRSAGKHLMAPRISPKKTWEGAAASLVFSVIAGVLLFHFSKQALDAINSAIDVLMFPYPPQYPPMQSTWVVVLISAVVNVAGQLGDLAESMMKRGAGVKDSGALLPGHGGILDRIDALLFAAPIVWYYALNSPLFR